MTRKTLRSLNSGSAAYVLEHAKWRASRGNSPSMRYMHERNPRKAIALAETCKGLNIIEDYTDPLPKCKKVRKGLRVKIHRLGDTAGLCIKPKHLTPRRTGVTGSVLDMVPGHGGDVWWVQHDGEESVGAYTTTEFKRLPTEKRALAA